MKEEENYFIGLLRDWARLLSAIKARRHALVAVPLYAVSSEPAILSVPYVQKGTAPCSGRPCLAVWASVQKQSAFGPSPSFGIAVLFHPVAVFEGQEGDAAIFGL